MSNVREMLTALEKPFPPNAIERREGAGSRMFDYVATETVIRRLNSTVGSWDFRVVSHEWTTPIVYTDKNNRERTERTLIVFGEMTVPGLGTRSGIGVQVVEITRGNEDMIKGATSDCLKKCATLFGVAIDLYGPDLEAGEVAHVQQMPQQARNTSQNTVTQQPQYNAPQTSQMVQARSGVPPTDKQFGMVGAIAKNLGMSPEELHQFAGVDSLNQLDRAQVSDLITRLKDLESGGQPPQQMQPRGDDDLPF